MPSTMPIWGAVALTLGVLLLTQISNLIIEHFRNNAANERQTKEHHELIRAEWHRNLRWAAEQITSDNDRGTQMGTAMLDALDDYPQLSTEEEAIIDGFLRIAVEDNSAEADYPKKSTNPSESEEL